MRAIKHIALFCLLLLAVSPGFAQYRNTDKALDYYKEKKLDSARIFIDSAVIHPQTKNSYETWMIHAFIYKDLYKVKESNNVESPLREIAVQSMKKALALDSANKNPQKEGILKSIKYQASMYHNDVIKTIDTLRYQKSLMNADKYVELMKYLDPGFHDKSYYYEVYLSIGSMFENAYEKGESKNSFDFAKVYLFKAYEINKNAFSVNKNIGFLYYNQAVNIIKRMDYDIPLDQLPIYQDQSVKLALQALSYCLKAHEIEPKDRAVLEALAGIYYLLNENEKHNEFKKKIQDLNSGK